jgi:RNA-directed DNA polymerase
MNHHQHLTAIGLAHALLAGDRRRDAASARVQAALGAHPKWIEPMLDQVTPPSQATWDRMTLVELAHRIEASPAFQDAFRGDERPVIRRWILRGSHMLPRPLGLDHLVLPKLDHSDALVHWLDIPADDLRWFTECPPRRRRLPLHRQHYAFSIQSKRLGGARLIEAPHQRLKAVQSRIRSDLLDRVPVHEACHGFVRGRSVATHAQVHIGRPVVVRFDLKDFFPTVTAAQVVAVFETLGYPPGVARDLTALCTVRTPEPVLERMREDGTLDWSQAKRLRSAHLPQGSPSSPMVANLCAFRLDLRLDGLAHALGARYSRYADDLVFSGPASLKEAQGRLSAWVGKIALEEGYVVNHRKTRLMTQATAQTVCGVVVNSHPNLRRVEFDRLRALLHRCVVDGPAVQSELEVAEFRRHLRGRLAWAEQLNPNKARRLHVLWDRIVWPADAATTIGS